MNGSPVATVIGNTVTITPNDVIQVGKGKFTSWIAFLGDPDKAQWVADLINEVAEPFESSLPPPVKRELPDLNAIRDSMKRASVDDVAKQICEAVHRLPYYSDSSDQVAAITAVLKEHYTVVVGDAKERETDAESS